MMEIHFPLLIDGGLSNVLEAAGCDLNNRLWSAGCLENDPEAIIATHVAYLEAGARCITTASYQATVQGFMEAGYSRTTAEELILRSVALAGEAIKRFMAGRTGRDRPLVAASIGPYGAYRADGSEYKGKYGLSVSQLMDFHRARLELLDTSDADLLACETIPDFHELQALEFLLRHTRKPAWISFSCRDGNHINDGTAVRDCVHLFLGHPTVFAVGFNCTAPRYARALVREIKACAGELKVVAYPNSGAGYDPASRTWSGRDDAASFATLALEWLEAGADIIGGCCTIGPEHIRRMARHLDNN